MERNLSHNNNWNVIYTFPNYEKKVNLTLEKIKIKTYLPLKKVVRQWSDRKKIIEIPLFPNYLFLQPGDKDKYRILDIYGVKNYVCSNGIPVKVSEEDIINIQIFNECQDLNITQDLIKGDKVKIIDGLFAGMTGYIFEKRGQTRLGVCIQAINQTLSIEIGSSLVQLFKE